MQKVWTMQPGRQAVRWISAQVFCLMKHCFVFCVCVRIFVLCVWCFFFFSFEHYVLNSVSTWKWFFLSQERCDSPWFRTPPLALSPGPKKAQLGAPPLQKLTAQSELTCLALSHADYRGGQGLPPPWFNWWRFCSLKSLWLQSWPLRGCRSQDPAFGDKTPVLRRLKTLLCWPLWSVSNCGMQCLPFPYLDANSCLPVKMIRGWKGLHCFRPGEPGSPGVGPESGWMEMTGKGCLDSSLRISIDPFTLQVTSLAPEGSGPLL